MNRKLNLPLGTDDFKEVVTRYKYIDKTKMISDVILNDEKVTLFCRPRRFGKSLNMSMLYYFFSNKYPDSKLFDGLNVSKDSEVMKHQGKYPTIFISLKDLGDSEEGFYFFVRELLLKVIEEFKKEIESVSDLENFRSYLTGSKQSINNASLIISRLVDCLYEYYNEQVVILIDEYDNPVQHAFAGGYEKTVISFLRNMLSPVFKGNTKVKLGVMTGILRITKESIFSGLNNLSVYDTMTNYYLNYFGLTENEVVDLLEYYEQTNRLDEIKSWYNGYVWGDCHFNKLGHLYNPWSTFYSIKDQSCKPYWVNTASIDIIKDTFLLISEKEKLLIMDLIDNKIIEREIDLQMTLKSNFSEDIFSLLVASGYLKVVGFVEDMTYKLEVVNYEIMSVFKQLIKDYLKNELCFDIDDQVYLKKLLLNKKIDKLETYLTSEFSEMGALDKKNEAFYHGGIYIMIKKIFGSKVITQQRSGYGYADLYLELPDFKYLIEFKKAKNEKEIDDKFEDINEQIIENEYYRNLNNDDVILGIVFDNKRCYIRQLDIS